ncbi:MAG: hypothetical protein Q8M26_08870 [Pseudolabrys sp.]|nr:hypothetical protein [Pseudolabrys sp.]
MGFLAGLALGAVIGFILIVIAWVAVLVRVFGDFDSEDDWTEFDRTDRPVH